MAIFKAPRIGTADRMTLILEISEVVYDSDLGAFYGGNGVTYGGVLISGYKLYSEVITITQEYLDNKGFELERIPTTEQGVLLLPHGGIPQRYGIDYVLDNLISPKFISWDGLGLDNFLEIGEQITVTYSTF